MLRRRNRATIYLAPNAGDILRPSWWNPVKRYRWRKHPSYLIIDPGRPNEETVEILDWRGAVATVRRRSC